MPTVVLIFVQNVDTSKPHNEVRSQSFHCRRAQRRAHPLRHFAVPELVQFLATQGIGDFGKYLGGQPLFSDVVESGEYHSHVRPGMLQAILGDMLQANDRVANLELSSRAAGVEGWPHLHLGAEAEPADSLSAVNLDRFPVRLRDDVHHSRRTGADISADVLVEHRTHVDTANDALQLACLHQSSQRFVDRWTGTDLRENRAGKGFPLLYVFNAF